MVVLPVLCLLIHVDNCTVIQVSEDALVQVSIGVVRVCGICH